VIRDVAETGDAMLRRWMILAAAGLGLAGCVAYPAGGGYAGGPIYGAPQVYVTRPPVYVAPPPYYGGGYRPYGYRQPYAYGPRPSWGPGWGPGPRPGWGPGWGPGRGHGGRHGYRY